jgi:hypothetical protein
LSNLRDTRSAGLEYFESTNLNVIYNINACQNSMLLVQGLPS